MMAMKPDTLGELMKYKTMFKEIAASAAQIFAFRLLQQSEEDDYLLTVVPVKSKTLSSGAFGKEGVSSTKKVGF